MKFFAIFTKVLGFIWLVAVGLVILAGIIGVWIKGGFSAVQSLLNPFNVANVIVTVIALAPGAGLLMLSEKLKGKIKA